MRHVATFILLGGLALASVGCKSSPPANIREYAITGQVLTIKADTTEVTVKHDDVPGFMPAMTMPFAIKDPNLLDGLAPGDLIKATLVVTDEESYLSAIQKTGEAPVTDRVDGEAGLVVADLIIAGETVPDLDVTCADGTSRKVSDYRGQVLLITFIFTRCPLPDFCPRMDAHFGQVQASIKRQPGLRGAVRLLSISFDPDHDTPEVLRAHAARVGAEPPLWQFATAPREAVDAFGARFGLTVQRKGAGDSNITHNLRTVLVGRDGALAKTYNGSRWSPSEVVADLEGLARRQG